MRWRWIAAVCVCLVIAGQTAAIQSAQAQPPALTVRADQRLGTISPWVFGTNYGPWSVVSLDTLPLAEQSGVTFLRYPGGEWGDLNDLTPFQIDMLYIKFARRLKAEPSISVRLKGSTPEKAAALVRYVNIEQQHGVRYWSIGNEPDLYRDYSAEQHAHDWRAFAEAMRAVDPTILLLGPELSQYPPRDNAGDYLEKRRAWLRAFLQANGDVVNVVTVHRYPFPVQAGAKTPTRAEVAATIDDWDYIIPDIRQMIIDTTGRELSIGITEVNSHWNKDIGGEATMDTHYNAVWWAASLARLINQRADTVTFFTLFSTIDMGPYGLLDRFGTRPTYYVYPLYQQFGTELVASASGDPDVTITASLREDGRLLVMVVNAATADKQLALDVAGFASSRVELWRLAPDIKGERVGLVDLTAGVVDLPAESASLYILPAAASAASVASTATPQAANSPEQRAAELLAQMTLDEKIGQMTLVEKGSIDPPDMATLALGGLLSGGGGYPRGNNTPQGWAQMVDDFQTIALTSRLRIPMMYGVDAVHGHAAVNGATVFPHNIGLGATRDPQMVEAIGKATAKEMIATGIYWNYSPVVAVVRDIRWGRTYESFGEDPALVTELSAAMLRGLQGDTLGGAYSVLATPKHYVGDGGTLWGSSTTDDYQIDQGVTDVDEATLRKLHLPPYEAAVRQGAQSIMVSFSSWGGLKMHAQKYLLTDVLKTELGFSGFLVSDWQGIDQIPGDYYADVILSINAGLDMIMVPYDYKKFINTLRAAVDRGEVSMERIDDAVRRILTVKFRMGLFERPTSDPALIAAVGSAEHRAMAREAVAKSLVLLKNDNQTLPLAKDTARIFVAGDAADDIGVQCGGWTIEWQGKAGPITPGTTILQGIRQAVGPGTTVDFERLGRFRNVKDAAGNLLNADVGIVVAGEQPYAEGKGDRADLSLSEASQNLIQRMRERSKVLVVVLVTGRPVILGNATLADSVVAAWLPGTEGAGVTDVLFGDKPFAGKLPFAWPASNDHLGQMHSGTVTPQFPFGFGLTTQTR